MTTIHISRAHHLTHAAARAVAEDVALDLQKEFGLQYVWEDEVLRFHTFGVRGELHVGGNAITLEAHLGGFVAPFQSSIEREIQRNFDRHLQSEEDSQASERAA